MTLTKLTRWSLVATCTAVGVGVAVGAAQTRTARAETEQAMTCTWKGSGSAQAAVYHAASAAARNGRMYVFGGLNQDGKVQQNTQIINMSATTGAPNFTGTSASTGKQMSQKGWGAAAAYVPSTDPAKVGTIYVIGGAKTDLDYTKFVGVATPPANYIVEGENTIFAYDIDSDSWSTVSGVAAMGNRLFPAATYSPEKNAILISGGMKDCDFLAAVTTSKACPADNLPAMWLTFDAMGAVTGLENESGGPSKVYGHTSVYDPNHKSILIYGGTSTGGNADRNAWRLDMTNPAAPAWSNLPNAPKGLAFHTAGYWKGKDIMVVNGGVSSAFFKSSEGYSSTTYGLNMSNPAAPAWSDLGATGLNPAERIGGVADYIENTTGLMNVVMSTGRRKLPSNLSSSQTVSKNNDVFDCTTGPVVTPTTPGGTTAVPTTPGGTKTTTPPPTVPPTPGAEACPGLETKAPAAAINAAIANAQQVSGYGMACNPNVPWNPVVNPYRSHLSLRNVNLPYHPVYNGFVWKCGCP